MLNALLGNWKTTLGGALQALGAYFQTLEGTWKTVGLLCMGLGALLLGAAAKDASTGSRAMQPRAPSPVPLVIAIGASLLAGCALFQGRTQATIENGSVCVSTTQYVTIGNWRCTGLCVGGAQPVKLECTEIVQAARAVAGTASALPDPSGTLLSLDQGRSLGLVR